MKQEPIGVLDYEKLRTGGVSTRFRTGRMGAKRLVLLLSVVVLLSVALVGCVPPTPEVIESTVEVTRVVERVVTSTLIPSSPIPVPTVVLPTVTPLPTQTSVPPTPSPTARPRVTLVKGPGQPVYLIIEGLERRWFPNSQAFEAFAQEHGLGWEDIKTHKEYPELWRQACRLPCGEPMPYYYLIPKGTLLRAAESPEIYQITTEVREGIKCQVKLLVSGEVDENEVACVSQGWLDALPRGSP